MFKSFCLVIAFMPLLVAAGTLNVKWEKPESYKEIRPTSESKARFQTHLFKQLDKHWHSFAKHLSEDMTLNIKVIDLDLAGNVTYNFAFGQEIRLVKPIYWPMMEFEYELLRNDRIVEKGVKKIRDISFMDRGSMSFRSREPYFYEKRIITDWFIKDVKPMLAKRNDAGISDTNLVE